MILITAATGQVGSSALSALVAAGEPVRALVRDPTEFAAPDGVQVVQGDFNNDTSMAKALEGVDCMLLAGRDSPDSVSQHRRVLAQVRQAGVRHVVKLSAIGASSASPIALMREHHEVDEEVRRRGQLDLTETAPLHAKFAARSQCGSARKQACCPDGARQISTCRHP